MNIIKIISFVVLNPTVFKKSSVQLPQLSSRRHINALKDYPTLYRPLYIKIVSSPHLNFYETKNKYK